MSECMFISSFCQAQAAIKHGIPKLVAEGIATERPQDYFAEMAKSDEHMKKVGIEYAE